MPPYNNFNDKKMKNNNSGFCPMHPGWLITVGDRNPPLLSDTCALDKAVGKKAPIPSTSIPRTQKAS